MVIDVHAHYLSPRMVQPRYRDLFDLGEVDGNRAILRGGKVHNLMDAGLMDLELQIADMERAGIDQRWLCVPPFAFHYKNPLETDWTAETNDSMETDTAPFGERFRLLANLPMGNIPAAIAELERVMEKPAFVGAQIATNLAGMPLADPALKPFWARAEELGAFVLLHPFYQIGDPRLRWRYNQNFIGNPLESTLAAFALACEGVPDRYPKLRLCLCHGGGYALFGMTRMDHGYEVRPEMEDVARRPSDSIRRLYIDTVVFDPALIEFLATRTGSDRILLGTDYPFDMADPDPVGTITRTTLSPEDKQHILHRNAERLLR